MNRWWKTFVVLVLLSIAQPTYLTAQDLDLAGAYDRAVAAVSDGSYDAGLAAINGAIKDHSNNAMRDFGPVFGHFYFLRGILLIKKKDYAGAIGAFRTCIEDYSNDALKNTEPDDPRLPNRYRTHALMQWAGCELAMNRYDPAIELYMRAWNSTEDYNPRIDRLELQLNLAKARLKSAKVDPAETKNFLNDKLDADNVPDHLKRRVFMLLATDWSTQVGFPEVQGFIREQSNLMRSEEPIDRYQQRDSRFLQLASQAAKSGDPLRALTWYGLVTPPGDVIREYQTRIVDLKNREIDEQYRAQANARIAEWEAEIPKLRQQLAAMYLGISASHYQLGSLAGARGAFLELARHYPGHKDRAQILHNLVVCDVNLGLWREAYEWGTVFFKEFPTHELRPAVAKVLVEVLFIEGNYAEALEVATDVRDTMTLGSEIRDIPDFVAAASLFHLNRFEEAEVELESYLANYPKGQRLEPINFYIGAVKTNLAKWPEATALNDQFATNYPDSAMRASSLFLAGLGHLVQENTLDSMQRVNELQEKYPDAPEIPASYNIEGDLLSADGAPYEESVAAYLEAKRLVEEDGRADGEVAGYSLRQLITGAVAEADFETAGAYFDEFQEKYTNTSWRTDATVAALPAMVELGRSDEALELLESIVKELGGRADDPAFDEMFGAYADFLTENFTIEEVRARYQAFAATTQPPAVQAWLKMAEIEAMEGAEKAERFTEAINQNFYALNALYQTEGTALSNYSLVRLARWNLKKRGDNEDARVIYDFILNERPNGEALGFALIDTARLETVTAPEEALKKFARVITEIDSEALLEEALLGTARIHTNQEDWETALAAWGTYLENRSHTLARPEANFRIAQTTEALGKKGEALKLYVSVYANFAGHLDWSTPAYLNTARLLHEGGRRLDSLKVLQDMLKRMGHLDHPNIAIAKERFAEWRAEYTASLQP